MKLAAIDRVIRIGVRPSTPQERWRAHGESSGLRHRPCVCCGVGETVAHHWCYRHGRLVLWMCRSCHRLAHQKIGGVPDPPSPESVVQERLGVQLRAAFQRIRDERRLSHDAELAREIGFPTTYVHWLALKRPWPVDAIVKLATAGQCHVDELLRIGNVE